MEARGTSPLPPRSKWLKRACQYRRENAIWMWNCSWRGRQDEKWIAPMPCILHEMFQHALEEGQKEVECMICQSCQHGLLKLDPKADASAIQLVGPQTCREEFKSLYYEVYKLQRLPRSSPREPELVAEVLSSLEYHLGWKGAKCHRWWENPIKLMSSPKEQDPQEREERCLHGKEPCWDKRSPLEGSGYGSHIGRRNGVAKLPPHQQLVGVLGPLQKPGSLQMEIQGMEEEALPEDCHTPTLSITLPGGVQNLKEMRSPWTFQLRRSRVGAWGQLLPSAACQKLRWGEYEDALSKPLTEELKNWVTWRAQTCETPNWWQELVIVPGVDNCEKLAHEVQVSFGLPQRVSEQCWVENDHQAPPAPPCLCKGISCHCLILSLPAGISRNSSRRRWWYMPKLFSSGWRRLIHLLEVNHAFWQGA